MNDVECHTLSAEGVRSYDYVRWKEETLAKQTSHKVTTPSLETPLGRNQKSAGNIMD